jgi:hypothetical protein
MASRKFIHFGGGPSAALCMSPFQVGVQPESGAHHLENGVRKTHFKRCGANIFCDINAL